MSCTRPTWVIIVSEPLAPDAITDDQVANESDRKDANRVIVSINGGGDVEGAGGGINQISITAGGTVRTSIDANSVQGAPSFTEAFSRCGGPMTLVVDESGSIGGAIGDVRTGVRRFVESLAGTPVKLQVVRFDTRSSVLGSSDWHRYFDMTNQADVDALLGAIDALRSSGGTNWEDAMFRTFYQADGTTASVIPETVVFFTDGVPTWERLARRADPGVLPAEPAAPGAPWPDANGSSYNQVAFNRADYIANKFRRSVRLVGVGVGAGITSSSDWIVDPGAGYRTVVERGSYSHVRESTQYQARYQKKNSSNGAWYWVDKRTYDSQCRRATARQDVGWTDDHQAQYRAARHDNDGRQRRRAPVRAWSSYRSARRSTTPTRAIRRTDP